MKLICSTVSLAILCGCAAPNTPGAGSGERYTPVIDMQGLDTSRYMSDLDSCRAYTRTINPAADAMAGALVGALVGAAIGSAVSSGTRWQGSTTRFGAGYGATSGTLAAGGRAVVKQETIMANCMAGRGYRTLDATVPVNYAAPSPYAPMQVASGAAVGEMVQQPMQSVSYNPAQYSLPLAPIQAAILPTGKDTYSAERLAKDQSCAAQPRAALSAKGAGFETYSVACSNGDTIAIRCEFGNCRVLR